MDIKIYNRWGGLVFETTDPDINWQGTDLQNKELAEGVYYYVCKYFTNNINITVNSEQVLNGYIHLIRGNK